MCGRIRLVFVVVDSFSLMIMLDYTFFYFFKVLLIMTKMYYVSAHLIVYFS